MTTLATVQFHNQPIVAIEKDGTYYVALRQIVENIGLDWAAQYTRIKRHAILKTSVVMMTTQIQGDDQQRKVFCLPLDMLNGWLFGVDVNRVKPNIRERLIQYQLECFGVLYAHFNKREPLPNLYKQQPGDKLSAEQQQALRQLLEEHVKRLPHAEQAGAMIKGWSKLKTHFGVGYRDIPAERYTEAVSLITRHVVELSQPQQVKAPSLINRRWFINFDHTGREVVTPLDWDDCILKYSELPKLLAASDNMVDSPLLANIANACLQRLATRSASRALTD